VPARIPPLAVEPPVKAMDLATTLTDAASSTAPKRALNQRDM
jgi:hypothetical protein